MTGNAIVLDSVPIDIEALKEQAPQRSGIEGTSIYQAEFVRALLRFGTQEHLYFLNGGTPSAHSVAREFTLQHAGRVHIVRPGTIGNLDLPRQVLFFTGGPDIARFSPLRRHLRRHHSPIVGITHSLNGQTLPLALTMLLTEGHADYDALICTTRSAEAVVRGYMSSMPDRLRLVQRRAASLNVRLPIIPLGVDVDVCTSWSREGARRRFGIAGDRVVVLYLGRFSTLTKADLRPLLRVFADSRVHWTKDALLVLAGDDSQYGLRSGLESIGAALGCADSLLVKPDVSRDEKFALLAAADVFVSPSDNIQETFGIGVAEAMAAGLPVVASDWDGYRDLVIHGETGLLVPTCSIGANADLDAYCAVAPLLAERLLAQTTVVDCTELGKALTLFVEDAELRRRFGDRAKQVARSRFDWRVVIGAYEDLWRELFCLADARSKEGTDAASTGVDGTGTFRVRDLFANYASATFRLDDLFGLVGEDQRWSDICGKLRILGDDGILSKDQLRHVVDELRQGPRSVRDLAHGLAMSEADAMLHVAPPPVSRKNATIPITRRAPSIRCTQVCRSRLRMAVPPAARYQRVHAAVGGARAGALADDRRQVCGPGGARTEGRRRASAASRVEYGRRARAGAAGRLRAVDRRQTAADGHAAARVVAGGGQVRRRDRHQSGGRGVEAAGPRGVRAADVPARRSRGGRLLRGPCRR